MTCNGIVMPGKQRNVVRRISCRRTTCSTAVKRPATASLPSIRTTHCARYGRAPSRCCKVHRRFCCGDKRRPSKTSFSIFSLSMAVFATNGLSHSCQHLACTDVGLASMCNGHIVQHQNVTFLPWENYLFFLVGFTQDV